MLVCPTTDSQVGNVMRTGMKCGGCVSRVKRILEGHSDVTQVQEAFTAIKPVFKVHGILKINKQKSASVNAPPDIPWHTSIACIENTPLSA